MVAPADTSDTDSDGSDDCEASFVAKPAQSRKSKIQQVPPAASQSAKKSKKLADTETADKHAREIFAKVQETTQKENSLLKNEIWQLKLALETQFQQDSDMPIQMWQYY